MLDLVPGPHLRQPGPPLQVTSFESVDTANWWARVTEHPRTAGGPAGDTAAMASRDDEHRGLADAAGRTRASPRGRQRASGAGGSGGGREVLFAPEIARVVDSLLAGPLPEEVARSLVQHRVLERVVAELAKSGELERLVKEALASPRTLALTDGVGTSDETQRALGHVASSPELRNAIARQTSGLTEEVVRGVRASAARLDDRAERVVHGPSRSAVPLYAGIATRAAALAVDAAITFVFFMSIVGVAALIASLVGSLRPAWLVGALLASGWTLIAATYFIT